MNRKHPTGNQRQTEQELRTPMAWQHRDINYQQQHHIYSERFGMVPEVGQMPGNFHYQNGPGADQYGEGMSAVRGPTRNRPRSSNQRPQSPSTDTSTSTSTGEHDTESHLKYGDTLARHGAMGTLRSIQSTITTWDGEPCPVHHLPMPHYPLLALPPPPAVLLPPMLRPRPLVRPADMPAPPEPLPIRDPVSPLPPKDINSVSKSKSCQCCKGHIIVLWIILCIILTGILLGTVLRFVFA